MHTVLGPLRRPALPSVKGVTRDGALTDADPLEAEVKRAMIAHAEEAVLLIDDSKLAGARAERHRPRRRRRPASSPTRRRPRRWTRCAPPAPTSRRVGGGRDDADAAPILALRDAAKSYGAVRALRDGSIALRAGEVRALVGENGAGKSTIVRLLGRRAAPRRRATCSSTASPSTSTAPPTRATPASR